MATMTPKDVEDGLLCGEQNARNVAAIHAMVEVSMASSYSPVRGLLALIVGAAEGLLWPSRYEKDQYRYVRDDFEWDELIQTAVLCYLAAKKPDWPAQDIMQMERHDPTSAGARRELHVFHPDRLLLRVAMRLRLEVDPEGLTYPEHARKLLAFLREILSKFQEQTAPAIGNRLLPGQEPPPYSFYSYTPPPPEFVAEVNAEATAAGDPLWFDPVTDIMNPGGPDMKVIRSVLAEAAAQDANGGVHTQIAVLLAASIRKVAELEAEVARLREVERREKQFRKRMLETVEIFKYELNQPVEPNETKRARH